MFYFQVAAGGEIRHVNMLRPVKSAESLVPVTDDAVTAPDQTPVSGGDHDMLGALETVTRAVQHRSSPKHHSRSSSHDSYFERKMSTVQFNFTNIDIIHYYKP